MTSTDGREWSSPKLLAAVDMGHYQISNVCDGRVCTAFNYHRHTGWPQRENQSLLPRNARHGSNLAKRKRRSGPYADSREANDCARLRLRGRAQACVLERHQLRCGRPSGDFVSHEQQLCAGPESGPREWFTAHWTGEKWERHPLHDHGPQLRLRIAVHRRSACGESSRQQSRARNRSARVARS